LNICDHNTRGKLIGGGVEGESGGVIRVYSASCAVNLWNIDLTHTDTDAKATEGGLISCSGLVSLYNCNLTGGKATKGGNVQLSGSGTFRMFGGTISGGKANTGGNINVNGRIYLENVVASNGSIYSNSDKECVYNGLTSDNFGTRKGQVKLMGVMNISKLNYNTDCTLVDGGIKEGSQIHLVAKPEKSCVVMTGASKTAFESLTSFKAKDYALSYDANKKTVTVTNTIVPKDHPNSHCACVGNGTAEHTCQQLSGWTQIS
jgi:hypothetical protein